jgi:N-formylglutamate amidohydrolase
MAGRTQRVSEGVADLSLAELTPPVVLHRAVAPEVPLIFTSPHSGVVYPADFVASSRLDPVSLRRSEDSFVDQLFDEAPLFGAPLLCARFPRAFCDANREKWELDPAMFADPLPDWVVTSSPRISAGLGTVARLVSSGETIYRGKLQLSEVQSRIEHCWQGFHDALAAEIARLREKFGFALLIDCHSMPRSSQPRAEKADIVVGDAHGTSCAPALVRLAEESLQSQGFVVRRNDPYAGGHITRHYGRPREAVHAIQIEICRSLYMDEARFQKNRQFEDIRARLRRFAAAMAAHAAGFSA